MDDDPPEPGALQGRPAEGGDIPDQQDYQALIGQAVAALFCLAGATGIAATALAYYFLKG